MDNEKVRKCIDSIDICAEGKKKIHELISLLHPGYKEGRIPNHGEVWGTPGSISFMIVYEKDFIKYMTLPEGNGPNIYCNIKDIAKLTNCYSFKYKNLNEYFKANPVK